MQINYISTLLFKGMFILLVIFILLEYFFGTITETSNTFVVNAIKLRNSITRTEPIHGPLWHTLLKNNKTTNTTIPTTTHPPPYAISNLTALFELSSIEPHENSTPTTQLCPDLSPNLRGRVDVITSPAPTIQQLERSLSWLQKGGHWEPDNCHVEKKLAIIVPFRCRGEHLLLFLQHIHPFLKRQQIDYTIFVIEQEGEAAFNRAMLMNVGFVEAMKLRNFDCFIFHDIDLLPEDDRNLYTCPVQPRHMSVAVDVFKYRLPYREIFGGVSAISREHFKLLNGFSNVFWGWGGEDDDMANRIKYHHLFISRYPINIARYTMLTHKKDTPSPSRYDLLKQGKDRYDKDGLNSLKYKLVQSKQNLLYSWMLVSIDKPS